MHSYSSTMTAKDVKALALKHNIPLDLHSVALTAEFRVPFSTLLLAVLDHFRVHISQLVPIGLTRMTLFELYCRSLHIVPSVNLFRVFYKIGKQGDWFTFERRVGPGSGGKILNETFSGLKGWKKSIDIRPVPSGLLFHAGLATTWEFSGFLPVFKDTEGNVVTMSEYLRFPFLDGATIDQGDALSARDPITQRTTGPLPVNQSPPEKTARLKEVETSDPKIVAIRERKARAAAKKRAERKRAADGEGCSKGKTKRRKVPAVRAEEEDSTEEASSASPLRAMAPNPSFLLKDVEDAGTAESREDEHVSIPRHDSANTSIHNYAADHDESFDESGGHGLTMLKYLENHPCPFKTRWNGTPVPAEGWYRIARGAMLKLCYLFGLKLFYDAHLALKERCEDVTRQLVSTRADFTHVSNLYNTLSNRYQQVRGEHAGCAEKLVNAERERDELRAVNADQGLFKLRNWKLSLLGKIPLWSFPTGYPTRGLLRMRGLCLSLGILKKKKIDSIGKLLPTIVRRLLNSHEYKESLSIPFNLAIQAGWAKGLAVKRSEGDLMDVLREVQGFDPY
ncbi:hypothetical protein Tco_0370395 [Tanacetum coccineum]